MERLSMVAPDLATRIQGSGDEQRLRIAASAAAEIVVERAAVGHDGVLRALEMLRHGSTDVELREALQSLAQELDARYWDLHDAHEAGKGSKEEYMAAFAQARAVSAVVCALDPDFVMAALEACYEAHSAFSDGSNVVATVSELLDRS